MSSEQMTDKERILSVLVAQLARPNFFRKPGAPVDPFAHVSADDPQVGDLVICQGSWRRGVHRWVVGWVDEVFDPNHCSIRELDSDSICDISNESFYVIKSVDPLRLLVGKQHLFFRKVLNAFSRGGEYSYRFGGLSFDGSNATIMVREVFGGSHIGMRSKPFPVSMKFNKRTSIKAILEAMKAAGYGTREFETEATDGLAKD